MTEQEQTIKKQRYDAAIRFMARLLNEWTTPFGCYYECNRQFHQLLSERFPRIMADIETIAAKKDHLALGLDPTFEAYGDLVVFCALCSNSLYTSMGTQRGLKNEFHQAMLTEVPQFLHDIIVVQKLHSHMNDNSKAYHDMVRNEPLMFRLLSDRMTLWTNLYNTSLLGRPRKINF